MSKELDLSDPSKLSQDDLRYAVDRYLLTEEQAVEAGFHVGDGGGSGGMAAGSGMGPDKDPADFKVAEVKAYLSSLDLEDEADAAEFDRVIEAEDSGEGRKGILSLAEG